MDTKSKTSRPLPPKKTDDAFVAPDKVEAQSTPKTSAPKLLVAHIKRLKWPPTKKQALVLSLLGIVLIGTLLGLFVFKDKPKPASPKPVTAKVVPPKPTTEASKLSGLTVPLGVNDRQVVAVMIENSPDARPQAGLKDAGVVYEAIAEGGITRFIALFQDTEPDYVGPIRSVRPYYIDWALPFDAAIAHVGGSPQGLGDLKSLNAKDLDQFANAGAYDRITSRYAPHNVYTSIGRLRELVNSKGFLSSKFEGFLRKKEQPMAAPTAKSIDLNISGFYYNVHYDYDAASNSYLRSEGGNAHNDDRSGNQLSPKVVVAIVMTRGIDGDGEHTDYNTVGSGKVYVFQDGFIVEGTWQKDSRNAPWKFTDVNGKDVAFNPGQTWLTIVDDAGAVSHQ